MSGTLGNLSVVLTLDDSGFTVGVKNAQIATKSLQTAIDNLNSTVSSSGSSFATASSAAAAWRSSLANSVSAATATTAAMQSVASSISAATAAMAAQTSTIASQTAALQRLATASAAVKSAGSGGSAFTLPSLSSLAGLAGGLLGVGTAVGVMTEAWKLSKGAIDDVIESGDRMTASLNQIQAVSGMSRDAAATFYDAMTAAAIKTGTATADLSKTTVQLLTTLGPLGQTPAQVLKIATTLAELQAVSGTSSAAATRAIRELVEGLSQGEAQLRQMKIIAQDDPALFTALSKAAHTTAGGLLEMASAGKLTSAALIDMLDNVGTNVDKTFASIPRTLAQSRTSLSDSLSKLAADLDHTFGGSQTLAAWDRMWSSIVSSLDHAVDTSIGPKLQEANREVATFQAQLAKPSTASIFGLPDDRGDIRAQLADALAYRDALQKQADAQTAVSDAAAKVNKAASDQAAVVDQATKAMAALGIEHGKTEGSQQALTTAIASGGDALVNYNGGLIRASELLAGLAAKATPAAIEIAKLNAALQAAQDASTGKANADLSAAYLRADPLDTTGNGANLTSAQRQTIQATLQQTNALEGAKAVQESQDRLQLAQAASMGKLAEATEKARQARAKFLETYGTTAATTAEADKLYANDLKTSQLTEARKHADTGKVATNTVDDLTAKMAELRAQISGTNAEEAKFAALIAENSKLKARGQEIIGLATTVGGLKQQLAEVKAAMEAVQKLGQIKSNATESLAGMGAYTSMQPTTELQKQFIKNQEEVNRQIEITRKALSDGSLIPGTANYKNAMNAVAGQQDTIDTLDMVSLRNKLDVDNQATLSDRLANKSSTGQGQFELQAADYQQQMDAILALTQAGTDQQKAMMSDLAAWNETQQRRIANANKDQLQKTAEQWGDWERMLSQDAGELFSSFSSALQETGAAGKKAWDDIGESALKMIDDLVMKLASSQILKLLDQLWNGTGTTGAIAGAGGASGGLGGYLTSTLTSTAPALAKWLGIGSSTTAAISADSSGLSAGIEGGFYHKGGMVGHEPTFSRMVAASTFQGARKYHTGGLAGDEIPTILQRGEGVFTKGQMAALGMQGSSMTALAAAVSSMASMVRTPPRDVSSPGNYNYNLTGVPGNVGGGGASSGNVVVNLHNQTGTQQTAVASAPKFDGEKMIMDIVVKHASQPGPFRTALRG